MEITAQTVDEALDEVRPYLQADGGDVEVASVSNGEIYLRFQVPQEIGIPRVILDLILSASVH